MGRKRDKEVCWCNGWRIPGLRILPHMILVGVTRMIGRLVAMNQFGRELDGSDSEALPM